MSDENKMDAMMSESAISDDALEDISGGAGSSDGDWRIVAGLETGYLAMRKEPTYDYKNEIRGCELYNGDLVKLLRKPVTGKDGRKYVYVHSRRHKRDGYVNAKFLQKL